MLTPRSWVPLDPDYSNRKGYDPRFLGVKVPLPRLHKALAGQSSLPVLDYQHFSLLLHPARRLARWTAVNIDGLQERRLSERKEDAWWFDKRIAGLSKAQLGNSFYRGSGFQRGHLVRRLDPAWGEDYGDAARGEADSFHWSNCSPQVPVLNTQWWLAVETHVLDTANALDQKIVVFSGCVFGDSDPTLKGVQVPLAFWKVVGWRTGKPAALRSLGFLVKQDEVIAQMLTPKARGPAMDQLPAAIRGYQMRIKDIEHLTLLTFGRLSTEAADVFRPDKGTVATSTSTTTLSVRTLQSPADLIVS